MYAGVCMYVCINVSIEVTSLLQKQGEKVIIRLLIKNMSTFLDIMFIESIIIFTRYFDIDFIQFCYVFLCFFC